MTQAVLPPPEAGEPVRRLPQDPVDGVLEDGTALCLSGGGYRAMLFHAGVLWRLNEAGLVRRLARVSSVSGGSITAAVLGLNWSQLTFDGDVAKDLPERVVEPLRHLARQHVDITAVLAGLGLPFTSISDRVATTYRTHLFGDATLQDLPDAPRFVLNATNLESGALLRFSKPYLADHRVGRVMAPQLPLAVVVAASSAFPPFLSPCTLDLRHAPWVTDEGNDLTGPEFRGQVRLSDGGVYDNLGLETAWKKYRTVLVSDAGGQFAPDPEPPSDWPRHMLRVLTVIDHQVRSLRKRQVIEGLRGTKDPHGGMYVGLGSHLADYPVTSPMAASPDVTRRLAAIPTRLDRMDEVQQELLVNWGYVVADAGLRAHVDPTQPVGALPYPAHPLVP